jgi:hypothetical protein
MCSIMRLFLFRPRVAAEPSSRLQCQALSSGGARWRLFRLAPQAPRQVAGHHVGDHGKQHQEHSDPENPTVVHSPPARAMIMAAVVLVIMLCLIHGFLVSWLDQYLAE